MKLIAYNTGESGGMMGGFSSKIISYTDDGRCKVESSGKPYHSQPIQHVTYYADGLLEKLSEVCERYNVISWTDLPEQDLFMHDAPTTSECFTFEDGTKITLGSKMKYPENAREMFKEINELINASREYGVDVVISEEDNNMMAMGMMAMRMGVGMSSKTVVKQYDSAKSLIEDTSDWAKFCGECGKPFIGDQKFCAECGAPRSKN